MSVELLMPPSEQSADTFATDSAPSPDCARTRVLHIINGDHYAGAERVQDLLAMRLGEHGFDVSFAVLKGGAFAAARASKNAAIFETPMRGRFDIALVRQIADIVRREGFSLIHAHTARSALIGRIAAGMAGVPMVYHVHSPTIRNTTNRLTNIVNTVVEARASPVCHG